MTLVVLGLRPSLHASARRSENLPVSLTALQKKVNRTEPEVLRALVQASAVRLGPAMAGLDPTALLPGWQVRVLDGDHLPRTEKRVAPLRGLRARMPVHRRSDGHRRIEHPAPSLAGSEFERSTSREKPPSVLGFVHSARKRSKLLVGASLAPEPTSPLQDT